MDEMMAMFQTLTGEKDDIISAYYLTSAKQAVLNKAFPFNPDIEEVPAKYTQKTLEIAIYLYNKQGAEGETTHKENGIDRTYESAGVPASMLREIIPFVGVVAKNETVEA